MKTTIKTALTLFFFCIGLTAFAEEDDEQRKKYRGKAVIQVFGNFHTAFGHGKTEYGGALDRCYLGYEYSPTEGLTLKGIIDFGQPDNVYDFSHIAYLKNASVTWVHKGLTLSGGLTATTQFALQERFWGYRYIMKSFQDEYGFGSSADLGITAAYRITDWLATDAMIVNGTGYKRIILKNGLNYGLGLTFTPFDGLQIRLYGGYNMNGESRMGNTANMAAFAGYTHRFFRIGAEYAHVLNAAHSTGDNRFGYSIFASVAMAKIVDIYARWDDLYTHSASAGSTVNDDMTAIFGAEIRLGRYVRLSPNFRFILPSSTEYTSPRCRYHAAINCCFSL